MLSLCSQLHPCHSSAVSHRLLGLATEGEGAEVTRAERGAIASPLGFLRHERRLVPTWESHKVEPLSRKVESHRDFRPVVSAASKAAKSGAIDQTSAALLNGCVNFGVQQRTTCLHNGESEHLGPCTEADLVPCPRCCPRWVASGASLAAGSRGKHCGNPLEVADLRMQGYEP